MAILLANLKKPYPELIETYKVAAKHENMMYLKYIWEKAILYNKRIQKDSIETNTKRIRKNANKEYANIDISEIINILHQKVML